MAKKNKLTGNKLGLKTNLGGEDSNLGEYGREMSQRSLFKTISHMDFIFKKEFYS